MSSDYLQWPKRRLQARVDGVARFTTADRQVDDGGGHDRPATEQKIAEIVAGTVEGGSPDIRPTKERANR